MVTNVRERLKQLAEIGIPISIHSRIFTPIDLRNMNKRKSPDLVAIFNDGEEYICFCRRFVTKKGKKFGSMKKILEEEGVNTTNLTNIRLESHYLFDRQGTTYYYELPSRKYLTHVLRAMISKSF